MEFIPGLSICRGAECIFAVCLIRPCLWKRYEAWRAIFWSICFCPYIIRTLYCERACCGPLVAPFGPCQDARQWDIDCTSLLNCKLPYNTELKFPILQRPRYEFPRQSGARLMATRLTIARLAACAQIGSRTSDRTCTPLTRQTCLAFRSASRGTCAFSTSNSRTWQHKSSAFLC